MDPEVRKLAKKFPWEGVGVSALMAFLLARVFVQGAIHFENRRYGRPQFLTWEEDPWGFVIVLALLIVFLAAGIGWTIYRLRLRQRLLQEDGPQVATNDPS